MFAERQVQNAVSDGNEVVPYSASKEVVPDISGSWLWILAFDDQFTLAIGDNGEL